MEFYNNEFKQSFLNNKEYVKNQNAYNVFKTVFKHTSKFEKELEKDLYKFSTQELVDMFGRAGWVKGSTINQYKSNIKKYYDYAAKQGLITLSQVASVGRVRYNMINRTEAISQMYYSSYKNFIAEFDRVFESVGEYKEYYITLRLKCILSLIWFGVHKNDLLSISLSDINKKDKTIHSKTLKKYIEIPDSVIDLCVKVAEITCYEEITGKMIVLPDTDEIIKVRNVMTATDNDALTLKFIFSNFKRVYLEQIKKVSNNKKELFKFVWSLNAEDIEDNGCFERAYRYEQQNGEFENNKDLGKFLDTECKSNINYKFWTYSDWKKVFHSEQ